MCGKYRIAGKCHYPASGKDYRHTYSPQCRAEIKRFFVPEWFRALTRLDGETLITRLENERNGFYG